MPSGLHNQLHTPWKNVSNEVATHSSHSSQPAVPMRVEPNNRRASGRGQGKSRGRVRGSHKSPSFDLNRPAVWDSPYDGSLAQYFLVEHNTLPAERMVYVSNARMVVPHHRSLVCWQNVGDVLIERTEEGLVGFRVLKPHGERIENLIPWQDVALKFFHVDKQHISSVPCVVCILTINCVLRTQHGYETLDQTGIDNHEPAAKEDRQ